MIKEAFINKNDIIPYLDTELNSVILHLVPLNAAVSFRLDEDENELEDEIQSELDMVSETENLSYARLINYVPPGESISIIKEDKGNNSFIYYSVGAP